MSVASDMDKGTTLGDADGPDRFVDSLGIEVPTFVDPRLDLVHPRRQKFKYLDYHVPFNMRGNFKPEDWPEAYREYVGQSVKTDLDGMVLCAAMSSRAGGDRCGTKAVNRVMFCRAHGGALHPADKKLSARTLNPMAPERIEKLDRVQKFMQGLLSVEDLEEDEIKGSFVRNDHGVPIKSRLLGIAFEQQIQQELHRRLNEYLRSKAPEMLKVVTDIALNPIAEDQDRFKAAVWAFERVGGKTPEVTIHGKTELPYEQIMDGVHAGSREDHRKGITSSREPDQRSGIHSDGRLPILDVSVEDDSYEDFEEDETEEDSSSGFQDSGDFHSLEGDHDANGDGLGTDGITASRDSTPGTLERVEAISEIRERAKEIHKKRTVLRKRRFAARATGSTSLANQWFGLEFTPITKGPNKGKWYLQLWPAEKMTPKVLDRIQSTADTNPMAQAYEAEADRMQAQLDKLRNGATNG